MKVDVWLAGPTLAQLAPAPRSIVNGDEAPSVVRTCCLGRSGLSRIEVSLAVDEMTAGRFARTCRLESIWRRWVRPGVLLAAAAVVMVLVIDVGYNHSRLIGPLLLASLILAGVTPGGRFVLWLLRSRHHPRVVERSNVLIRDVDRETARVWADANPPGAINIVG